MDKVEVIIKLGDKKCEWVLDHDVEYLERLTIYDLILQCDWNN